MQQPAVGVTGFGLQLGQVGQAAGYPEIVG
jgi:hypothetical protein